MFQSKIMRTFVLLSAVVAFANSAAPRASSSTQEYTEDELTAEIPELGKIYGKAAYTLIDRKEYIQFLGIPYALNTGGNKRFLPSELREGRLNSTSDTFQALNYGLPCRQPNGLLPVPQDEDCLFINVFTPKICKTQNCEHLPVVVFIHGGAFTIGSGNAFSASRILNRDVVYVTFNYRMGILGFFCLQTEMAPGNAAMYDMVNALTWVNKYISYFGGDKNLVTIAGQSAGSVAVTHMMLSPLARGLFHRAIAHSGSILNDWGHTKDPVPSALVVARMAGCPVPIDTIPDLDAMNRITECMRTVDATVLVDTLYSFQIAERLEGRLGFGPVTPVVQNFGLTTIPAFLPEDPLRMFERGEQANVPLLMGTALHDGSYVAGVLYNRYLTPNDHITNADYMKYELVPAIMRALAIQDDSYGVYEALAKSFLGDQRLSGDLNSIINGIIDINSVFFFKAASYRTAELHSNLNETFWFSFDFVGSQTLWALLFNYVEVPPFQGGITHTDDLIYLYPLTLASLNTAETAVSNRMLDYWYNFARYGDPTPRVVGDSKWPSLTGRSRRFMSINRESVVQFNYPDTWEHTFSRTASRNTTMKRFSAADYNPELLLGAY